MTLAAVDSKDFRDSIGPERLVSISHSADRTAGAVTVWYWGDPDDVSA